MAESVFQRWLPWPEVPNAPPLLARTPIRPQGNRPLAKAALLPVVRNDDQGQVPKQGWTAGTKVSGYLTWRWVSGQNCWSSSSPAPNVSASAQAQRWHQQQHLQTRRCVHTYKCTEQAARCTASAHQPKPQAFSCTPSCPLSARRSCCHEKQGVSSAVTCKAVCMTNSITGQLHCPHQKQPACSKADRLAQQLASSRLVRLELAEFAVRQGAS